ncbi:hypothetical protein MCEMRE191_01362 [Candidatus Nanopelagicaceae bacterium]
MSTKTSFKRIALVAVAALGFGMLSVVPSNAETAADTMVASATASSTTVGTAASIYVTQTFIDGDTTPDYVKATAYVISAPAYSVALPTWTALTSDSATALGFTQVKATMDATVAGQIKVTNSQSAANYVQATNMLSFLPLVPGTYVIKVYQTNATDAGAAVAQAAPLTWTVTAGSTNPANSTYTKAYMVAGSGHEYTYAKAYDLYADETAATAATTETQIATDVAAGVATTLHGNTATIVPGTLGVAGGAATVGNYVANIALIARNNTPVADTALASPITVTLTGPGYVAIGSHAVLGKSVVESVVTAGSDGYASNKKTVWVISDGTTGTSTVTISQNGATLATKTLIFYGTAAKITSTGNYGVLDNSGTAVQEDELSVYVADAAGNPVLNAAASIKLTSSDLTVLQSSAAGSSGCAADAISGAGYYTCSVKSVGGVLSGKSATITPSIVLSTTSTITGDAVKYSIGGSTIYSLTLTTDAASYDVGTKGYVILTAKDSAGNPVADTVKFGVFNAVSAAGVTPAAGAYAGLSVSAPITTTPFAAAANTADYTSGGIYFTNGVAKASFYAPSTSASSITFSGTAGASSTSNVSTALKNFGYGTALSVTAGINQNTEAADAAAEATDAANAATDAANAAAEAADAATAAAQDAADAVAALSTQVSAMVDALKKQITALTNLVIKIQKKVKA